MHPWQHVQFSCRLTSDWDHIRRYPASGVEVPRRLLSPHLRSKRGGSCEYCMEWMLGLRLYYQEENDVSTSVELNASHLPDHKNDLWWDPEALAEVSKLFCFFVKVKLFSHFTELNDCLQCWLDVITVVMLLNQVATLVSSAFKAVALSSLRGAFILKWKILSWIQSDIISLT